MVYVSPKVTTVKGKPGELVAVPVYVSLPTTYEWYIFIKTNYGTFVFGVDKKFRGPATVYPKFKITESTTLVKASYTVYYKDLVTGVSGSSKGSFAVTVVPVKPPPKPIVPPKPKPIKPPKVSIMVTNKGYSDNRVFATVLVVLERSETVSVSCTVYKDGEVIYKTTFPQETIKQKQYIVVTNFKGYGTYEFDFAVYLPKYRHTVYKKVSFKVEPPKYEGLGKWLVLGLGLLIGVSAIFEALRG